MKFRLHLQIKQVIQTGGLGITQLQIDLITSKDTKRPVAVFAKHLDSDKSLILLNVTIQHKPNVTRKRMQLSSMFLTTRRVILLPSHLKSKRELRQWGGVLASETS